MRGKAGVRFVGRADDAFGVNTDLHVHYIWGVLARVRALSARQGLERHRGLGFAHRLAARVEPTAARECLKVDRNPVHELRALVHVSGASLAHQSGGRRLCQTLTLVALVGRLWAEVGGAAGLDLPHVGEAVVSLQAVDLTAGRGWWLAARKRKCAATAAGRLEHRHVRRGLGTASETGWKQNVRIANNMSE